MSNLGVREQKVLWNFIRKGHPKILTSKPHIRLFLPSGSLGSQGLLKAVRKMNRGVKSFARGAGEESPRDNRQERAEVEKLSGVIPAAYHPDTVLATDLPRTEQMRPFPDCKSQNYSGKRKMINSFLIS